MLQSAVTDNERTVMTASSEVPPTIDWAAEIQTMQRAEDALASIATAIEAHIAVLANVQDALTYLRAESNRLRINRQKLTDQRNKKRTSLRGRVVHVHRGMSLLQAGESHCGSEEPGNFSALTRNLEGEDGEILGWLDEHPLLATADGPWIVMTVWLAGKVELPHITYHPDFFVIDPLACQLEVISELPAKVLSLKVKNATTSSN
jgi:hypothetical protein